MLVQADPSLDTALVLDIPYISWSFAGGFGAQDRSTVTALKFTVSLKLVEVDEVAESGGKLGELIVPDVDTL